MKKTLALLLCCTLAIALCSCFLYDENDAEFTGEPQDDPTQPETPDDPVGPSVITDPGIVGTSYVADGFTFVIPVAWRGHLSVTINEITVNGIYVVERLFYFLDANGVGALIMRIYEVATEGVELLGIKDASVLCKSLDGSLSFMNIPVSVYYPDNFTAINDFVSVFEVLGSSSFVVEANV